MNRNIIIAGIALAGVGAFYLIRRLMGQSEPEIKKKSHHLTDVFSKAKEYAIHN